MVATASTSAFFAAISVSLAKAYLKHGGGHLNMDVRMTKLSKPPASLKVNTQALQNLSGNTTTFLESTKTDYGLQPSPSPLPDWPMLLTSMTGMVSAAEEQRALLDPEPPNVNVDQSFGLGKMVQDGLVYRQNFSIRSYQIGADKTASIDTLMNHLQETALNHCKTVGLMADGFGSTPEMCKRDLIWVIAKMNVLVDRYPTWGDVVQVDTYVVLFGKNGMRRDWLISDCNTGETLARATSVMVMMNKNTRRLSKMPEEVRAELEPCFMESAPLMIAEDNRKLLKLDEKSVDYVRSGLTPQWNDLDVNQHVNNVKYIGWILESAPLSVLQNHELCSLTLEYRKECGRDSILDSLTSLSDGNNVNPLLEDGGLECNHLLQLNSGGAEIVRGRTNWRPKLTNQISTESL